MRNCAISFIDRAKNTVVMKEVSNMWILRRLAIVTTLDLVLGYTYYRVSGGPPIPKVIKCYRTMKKMKKIDRDNVIPCEGTVT